MRAYYLTVEGWTSDPDVAWKLATEQLRNEYNGISCPKIPQASIRKMAEKLHAEGFSSSDVECYLEAEYILRFDYSRSHGYAIPLRERDVKKRAEEVYASGFAPGDDVACYYEAMRLLRQELMHEVKEKKRKKWSEKPTFFSRLGSRRVHTRIGQTPSLQKRRRLLLQRQKSQLLRKRFLHQRQRLV